MLYSEPLEKEILALLIKHPSVYSDIDRLVESKDFYLSCHRKIFDMILILMKDGHDDEISEVVLIDRLEASGVSFSDSIKISEYIRNALGILKVSESSALNLAKELRNYRARRDYDAELSVLQKLIRKSDGMSLPELVNTVDSSLSSVVNTHGENSDDVVYLFKDSEEKLLSIAENPIGAGFEPDHLPITTEMVGSLLVPANIFVLSALSGVGKTTYTLDYALKTSVCNGKVPVLHMDNGEMSADELFCRQLCAISGVREYYIRSGKWRTTSYLNEFDQEVTPDMMEKAIYKALPELEKYNFGYIGVGGKTPEEKIRLAKRHYYKNVGRGKPMILSYDYIKSLYTNTNKNLASWEAVGQELQMFKDLIKEEIKFDGKPMVAMITSVQQNRQAIINNRNTSAASNDMSHISLSMQIAQYASQIGHLRKLNPEELLEIPACYRGKDGEPLMTHNMLFDKTRYGGEDFNRQSSMVSFPALDETGEAVGTSRIVPNSIYLRSSDFKIDEVCDARQLAESMRTGGISPIEDGDIAAIDNINFSPIEDGGDDVWNF